MADESIPDFSPQEARKARKNAQARQRRLASPEEVRAVEQASYYRNLERSRINARLRGQRYRARRRANVLATGKKYRETHKTELAERAHDYYEENGERLRERSRGRRREDPEKPDAATKKWRAANPEAMRRMWLQHRLRRRALKAAAPINDFTDEQWRVLCYVVDYRCCYCDEQFPFEELTPDHLTPYNDGGSNTLHNILPCCGSCNSRKGIRSVLCPVQPFLLLEDESCLRLRCTS